MMVPISPQTHQYFYCLSFNFLCQSSHCVQSGIICYTFQLSLYLHLWPFISAVLFTTVPTSPICSPPEKLNSYSSLKAQLKISSILRSIIQSTTKKETVTSIYSHSTFKLFCFITKKMSYFFKSISSTNSTSERKGLCLTQCFAHRKHSLFVKFIYDQSFILITREMSTLLIRAS